MLALFGSLLTSLEPGFLRAALVSDALVHGEARARAHSPTRRSQRVSNQVDRPFQKGVTRFLGLRSSLALVPLPTHAAYTLPPWKELRTNTATDSFDRTRRRERGQASALSNEPLKGGRSVTSSLV